jgi:ABC-type glycerol-3-phosphate transport system permease component
VALTTQQDLGAAMISSSFAIGTTVLSLIVCAIAGYGFEIYHSRGKDVVMAILMLAMMIPFAAIMIPLFRLRAVRHGQLAVRGDHPLDRHATADPAVPAGVALVPV